MNMSNKPSYLGLLNAIAVGEGRAHSYLRAWADTTDDPEVRRVIETVAIREGEHALAFEKRICELGYSLRQSEDENLEKNLALVTSDRSDLEKFEKLGLAGDSAGSGSDPFTKMFEDTTIDVQTGELLGRYIAEERDSGRLFRACYQKLRSSPPAPSRSPALAADVQKLRQQAGKISDGLQDLRREVSALRG
jgi:rubrerythrin